MLLTHNETVSYSDFSFFFKESKGFPLEKFNNLSKYVVILENIFSLYFFSFFRIFF